jgi:1-acyl-sn-glycerol-3-phosphate acyltransferase
MLATVPVLGIYHLVRLIVGDLSADKFAYCFTRFWARSIILTTGSKVNVAGSEHISPDKNVCFICNHQGYFDIPLLMGWLDRPVGFIAKQELKKIPVLSGWITAIHSAFLDRSNARKALDSIQKGVKSIQNGHAIIIFPEGSRSHDCTLQDFKVGSLKLAVNAHATIQPITINNTRNIFELTNRIHKSKVALIIHEPIKPDNPLYNDRDALSKAIFSIINSALLPCKAKYSGQESTK